ncbi:Uncharacterised protein [Bordetella pertussis]|nr:Uncharacterised protein [Bordetella pertussis]CFP60988.1 Uncharacterised protein [Bordetella pertussis]CPL82691.1 Uncharacterised protein [Bordetella pertussis]
MPAPPLMASSRLASRRRGVPCSRMARIRKLKLMTLRFRPAPRTT